MHIPDGVIAPQLYLPAYALGIACWSYGLRHLRRSLEEQTIPRLAMLTAAAFVLMMTSLPLPGGITAHASGVGILAVLFGVWTTYVAISVVLLLQAVMFAHGGVTTLPINALAMGLLGAGAARLSFRALRRVEEHLALLVAGWVSAVVPAVLTALALGIQPAIARAPDGSPLFFPLGLEITLPLLTLPYVVIGIGEGLLTALVYTLVRRREGNGP
jgi:cobalt/nickel transport system permease protein